jgi:polyhydroxybutyrate depolymerase
MSIFEKLKIRSKRARHVTYMVAAALVLSLGFTNCGRGFQVSDSSLSSLQSPLGVSPTPTPAATATPQPSLTPQPTTTPTPTPSATNKSAGCGKTGVTSGAFDYQKLVVNGKSHDYSKIIPANYNPNEALPLVLSLHCAGLTAQQYRGAQGVSTETETNAEKAIVLYPEATVTGEWEETCGGTDMVMIQAVVDMAKANYCINTDRVFITGFSWGADMSNAVGCCLGKSFRAVQPMSGGESNTGGGGCQSPTPAYMQTYGTADEVYSQGSIQSIIQGYRTLQSCKSTYTMKDGCKVYDGCKFPVIDCPLDGVHHTIPNDSKYKMWNFFSSFK